ncbi:MAG: DUF4365 domain-containing protein [Symploca sp. SIO2E6]|nr:DUF4365 domain-containing protein [Symploca sp. SIO2E6]
MMKQDMKHFIAQRAENLAVVYLSRSHNLAIEHMRADYGLDLLVTILRDNLPTGRVFGVQVQAQEGLLQDTPVEIAFHLSPQERSYLKELPFPVCALLFTMDNDMGYGKWLRYPTANQTNPYSLAQSSWRCLDELPIEQMLKEVNAWYDQKSLPAVQLENS